EVVYLNEGIFDVELTANISTIAINTKTEEDYITVLPAVKVNENVIYGEVEIFPNPSSGSLTIHLQNQNECQIKVIDLLGNTIYDQIYIQHNRKISLDLSENPEGLYFLKIKSNNVNFIEKIVLKK
ncbi:MAG: T9SS type A sorting domain-containing protein, partial [Bacteroidales bacterium]|nr:T9SS type A sorting domain-containing protein [Bacteroidales bacterium]